MSKVSIVSQIAEVERELAMRASVYPRQVAAGKMRQGEADLLITRLRAVRETLFFCQQHEPYIRAYMAVPKDRPLHFTYRNWRGEVSQRTATPRSIRFGSTEWHPGPQWLMLAFDHDRQAVREFAMADICAAKREGRP